MDPKSQLNLAELREGDLNTISSGNPMWILPDLDDTNMSYSFLDVKVVRVFRPSPTDLSALVEGQIVADLFEAFTAELRVLIPVLL